MAKSLTKHTTVLGKDGEIFHGSLEESIKGRQPQPVVEETKEEKKARLLQELSELE